MDANLQKALLDRVYDKRKAATLDLERQVRDCLARGDRARVNLIVQQLCSLLTASPQNLNARNGGLIGLAGIGIALGLEIAPYLEQIAKPVLACFSDPDSKIRYFACESFYNIAKVCKGEILVYFNEIFDALSKLAADSELSVKNGAELLDRLLKDIVCEAAPHYVSQFQHISHIRARQDALAGFSGGHAELDVAREKAHTADADPQATAANRVFSLARFVPLLAERMYVISPFTRNYLVSWITVLDSLPDLELVSYLPSFLDGLLKYLSDPNTDVRVATANVLADFLREIRDAAQASTQRAQRQKQAAENAANAAPNDKDSKPSLAISAPPTVAEGSTTATIGQDGATTQTQTQTQTQLHTTTQDTLPSRREGSIIEREHHDSIEEEQGKDKDKDKNKDIWVPGHEIRIDYAAIMEILINHIGYPDEEIQATTLQWIAELLLVVKHVVVPFTPRLIPAILPSLAHHSPAIASAANATNLNLYRVIQELPAPPSPTSLPPNRPPSAGPSEKASRERLATGSPTTMTNIKPSEKTSNQSASTSEGSRRPTISQAPAPSSAQRDTFSPPMSPRNRAHTLTSEPDNISIQLQAGAQDQDPSSSLAVAQAGSAEQARARSRSRTPPTLGERDPFDYQTTVNALTLQLLDEHEETRVTALEWLLMLHQKCPRKILSMDDGTFPALLKTLSDPSDEVIRSDLRLLAQISSASEDSYFHAFIANLLSLFSTDRRLLETRGSLIIRQLCASLNTERIFRTLAEILEKDEDLEFASIMVQNLSVILITSPELSDFRKRLRNLDSKDGQMLFVSIYRSWCHNAVAAFSLCLLAQAYEHASNLLGIFAEQLEMTVSLLIQIDMLVQLLESPIFTALRLQLLEPEKHPYLFKCLYGLLMLLPQSSAFVTLRNRLSAVNGLGFLHSVPRSSYAQSVRPSGQTGKTVSRDEIKWSELLTHFKVTQARHERARRASATGSSGGGEAMVSDLSSALASGANLGRTNGPPHRRKASQSSASTTAAATNQAAQAQGAGANSRFAGMGLGLSTSGTPGRTGQSRNEAAIPPSASSSSSFFGMHLSGSAGNRSTSPTNSRRPPPGTAAASRVMSKGSGYR